MTRGSGLSGPGDPSPINVPGGEPPVLAIHGFGGTPLEVELVVDVARDFGLRAHAPLLPGHGSSTHDLAQSGWADWLRGADEALTTVLRPDAKKAIVVGLSLGALLAAHLALTYPERVRGLGMLASATRLRAPFPAWPLELIDRFRLPDFSIPKAGADIADPNARANHLTSSRQPVHAAIEVLRAGERVERLLGQIRLPAFVAHGKHDRVCPVSNARRIEERLGSTEKTVVILPRSHHIVTRDYDRGTLRSELSRFIERLL